MADPLVVILNGKQQTFAELAGGCSVRQLLEGVGLKQDRVAIEVNGEIVGRSSWATSTISDGDRVEIVHFVGGGNATL